MSRVRLVSVQVQPVFLLDDGETLTPVDHPSVMIPAAEWPTYSSERFPREVAEWQAQLDAEASDLAGGRTDDRRVVPDVLGDDAVRADAGVAADRDARQHDDVRA